MARPTDLTDPANLGRLPFLRFGTVPDVTELTAGHHPAPAARKTAKQGPGHRSGGRGREPVRAAGVVLWRLRQDGPEVALIHRPRYDDWSFPKGKLRQGERHRDAARREAREETGMAVVLGGKLPTRRYCVRGREKRVRYWAAQRLSGQFAPGREADRLEWLLPAAARARLSHERDRVLVDALLDLLHG